VRFSISFLPFHNQKEAYQLGHPQIESSARQQMQNLNIFERGSRISSQTTLICSSMAPSLLLSTIQVWFLTRTLRSLSLPWVRFRFHSFLFSLPCLAFLLDRLDYEPDKLGQEYSPASLQIKKEEVQRAYGSHSFSESPVKQEYIFLFSSSFNIHLPLV